jgi:hypothetical protein
MNWDKEMEIEVGKGEVVSVTVGEIHSILMAELTMDELEDFATELMKGMAVERSYLDEE